MQVKQYVTYYSKMVPLFSRMHRERNELCII